MITIALGLLVFTIEVALVLTAVYFLFFAVVVIFGLIFG